MLHAAPNLDARAQVRTPLQKQRECRGKDQDVKFTRNRTIFGDCRYRQLRGYSPYERKHGHGKYEQVHNAKHQALQCKDVIAEQSEDGRTR
jgi:hypothetical protein